MIFQQIRSATIKLTYDNVVFLIDPWLRDSALTQEVLAAKSEGRFISTPLVPLPLPADDVLADVDYVLVTHLHSDHFTADHLPKDAPLVFQNRADMEAAKELGFENISCFCEDTMRFRGVSVTRVNCRHGDTDAAAQRMGACSGFVFTAEREKTIYVAGDTVFYDGVKQTIDKFRPEVIIVNACDARVQAGRLIMNKEDVAALCDYAPNCLVIASHMETVSHARLTRAQLRAYMAETPFAERVLLPEDGECIRL